MPSLAIIGAVIGVIALIAIAAVLIWGEKSTPGKGFVSEMNEAEKELSQGPK